MMCVRKGGMRLNPRLITVPRRLRSALLNSLTEYKFIFLFACVGWGKTSIVNEVLKSQTYRSIKVQCDRTPRFSYQEPLVVLDDFQNLSACLEERVAGIFRRSSKRQRFFLLSRGPVPTFLLSYQYSGDLCLFQSDDLRLQVEDIALLAVDRGLTLSTDDLLRVEWITHGYPPYVGYLLDAMAVGKGLGKRERESALRKLDVYWDSVLYQPCDPQTRSLLLRLSYFSEVTDSLVAALHAGSQEGRALQKIARMTGILQPDLGGRWSYCDPHLFLPYLQRQAEHELTADQIKEVHLAGGAWCAEHGNFAGAAGHFLAADHRDDLVRTLVQAIRQNTEWWALVQLEPYLHTLTHDEICSAPELLYAMCRVSAMAMEPAAAETWYAELRSRSVGSDTMEANSYLLYLDLILHNTSPADLASRCREALPRIEDGRFLCHPTAITCGLPSVLRGERDLSDFFLPATAAPDKSVRLVVDHALGRHSVGLGELLRAEHLLEQGEDIAHLLLQWHPLQLRIRDEGTLPSEFVCVALMARSLCAEGQLPEAAAFLLRFRQRVEAEGADYLIHNIDAMRCRLALMEDSLYAANWFAAQSSGDGIWLLPDVYRLLTKVRCHIRREEYHTALLTLGHLLDRFSQVHRPLDTMEVLILTAICRFRMGGGDWAAHLGRALSLGERYGYVTVFAQEGAALMPLLEAYAPGDAGSAYWSSVIRRTLAYARHYPWYLQPLRYLTAPLTPAEREVLSLILRHKTNEEIGQLLNIRASTVKTHIRNLFCKLGVHNREEARRTAIRLQLDQ